MTVLINEGLDTKKNKNKNKNNKKAHFPEQLGMRPKHGTHGRGAVGLRQEEKYKNPEWPRTATISKPH